MKKFLIMIIAILLITSLAVALVACTDYDDEGRVVLKTPTLTVNGNAVTWSSVKNAEKYGIVINDDETNEITITGTSYTVILGGTNNIRVRAIGDLKKYGYSAYSENASVTTAGKLSSPTMNDIVINDDGSAKFSWTSVEGASSYRFEVKSEGTTLVSEDITGNEYTLSAESIKAPAYYSYRVKAISAGSDADSEFTNTKNYAKEITLSAPEAPKQRSSTATKDKSAYIDFTAPEYANRYTVEAYDTNGTVVKYSLNYAKTDVQISIESIPIKTAGEYKVRIRAEHSTNNLCAPSEFVEVMKEDGTTPLTLTLYGAPQNIKLDGSMLTWNSVADGMNYILNYKSGGNSITTDSVENQTNFDLSTSARIKASDFAGLLVDVTMNVGKDLSKGILDGLTSEVINYSLVEKPELITEGNYNGYYEVDSIAKLNYINTEPTAKYVLTKNINCKSGIITPITGEFKGVLDGNGYSINQFTLKLPKDSTRTKISLFGNIATGAEIKNIGIFDATVTVNDSQQIEVGLLALTNNGTISDVNVKATINVQNRAAAIALDNNGKIINAFFSGTISGHNRVGAIASTNAINATITNARVFTSTLSTASTTSYDDHVYLGGIVGENAGTIKYAGVENTTMTALTYVTNRNVYLGGIAGRSAGNISTAYVKSTGRTIVARTDASGNASKAYSAGLVGILAGSITDSYAIGGTYTSANYSGTFAGEILNAGSVKDCYTANLLLDSHANYIVSKTVDDGASLTNLYYYNRNNHALSENKTEFSNVTRIGNRADMNDSNKVKLPNMSKNTLVQDEFMTLNNMLYFAKGDTYVNTATKSSLTDRKPGKVYTGTGEEVSKVTKFDSVKATSGTTTYDIYSKELDGTVLILTKSFKITG